MSICYCALEVESLKTSKTLLLVDNEYTGQHIFFIYEWNSHGFRKQCFSGSLHGAYYCPDLSIHL